MKYYFMKYYLWDWYGTNTIEKRDMDFHSVDYANSQNAFTTFSSAKKKGIMDLKDRIKSLQDDLKALRKLEITDVKEVL